MMRYINRKYQFYCTGYTKYYARLRLVFSFSLLILTSFVSYIITTNWSDWRLWADSSVVTNAYVVIWRSEGALPLCLCAIVAISLFCHMRELRFMDFNFLLTGLHQSIKITSIRISLVCMHYAILFTFHRIIQYCDCQPLLINCLVITSVIIMNYHHCYYHIYKLETTAYLCEGIRQTWHCNKLSHT